MSTALEILRRTRTDADFYTLLGPFLARREVVAAVGGPVWDDDGKTWFIARQGGAVVGFLGATVAGSGVATLASSYVVPTADAAPVWDALLADARAALHGRATRARATVADEKKHFSRAGFRATTTKGRFTVVERSI